LTAVKVKQHNPCIQIIGHSEMKAQLNNHNIMMDQFDEPQIYCISYMVPIKKNY